MSGQCHSDTTDTTRVLLSIGRLQSGEESEEDLVEYEGMLVSVAAAQRRRWGGAAAQGAA